jgi:hypothetical protein
MECVAHFHGEMAEFFWPTLNQIGGYIREMNRGHRHDSIIDHHGDWNWNKKANAGSLKSIILKIYLLTSSQDAFLLSNWRMHRNSMKRTLNNLFRSQSYILTRLLNGRAATDSGLSKRRERRFKVFIVT